MKGRDLKGRFIKGHKSYIQGKRPKEIGLKISKAKMGHKVSKETRQKLRVKALEQFKNGMPKETREKLSKMFKGKNNPKLSETLKRLYREGKIISPMLGKHLSEKTKEKISKALKGKSTWNKGKPAWNKGKKCPQISKGVKKLWKNKEYRENQLKSICKAMRNRPTSLEKQMIDIINKYNLPYKYVGDGDFILGGKNPDFINTNGEKIAIEVANTYEGHHPKDYEEKRKKHFAKYGWKCIIFKTKKLNEEEVLGVIM